MGGKKAPNQTVNNVQSNAPWGPQGDQLRGIFNSAQQYHGTPQTFFPGQTYASFSPQTEQALNLTEQRALAGSPVQKSANQELINTLNGNYLTGGAGFNAALDAARNRILPDIQSRYNKGGRYGSGLAREAEAKALADSFSSQYDSERQRQLQSMLFAPQAAQADYQDMNALAGVGAQREGQAQSAIDEARMRHEFGQNENWNRLAKYLSFIQGEYGNQGTSSQTTNGFKGNRGAGILGGALGGAQMGGQFGGPWGAGIGGILGGLSGLF